MASVDKKRASSAKLEPGDHSIDRATPWQDESSRKWMLAWSLRLPNGKLLRRRTQSDKHKDLRPKARKKAEELLDQAKEGQWKPSSELAGYIERISRREIETSDLRPRTKEMYLGAVRLILGDCKKHTEKDGNQHKYNLKNESIDSMKNVRLIERCLQEIAELHGYELAEKAQVILSKYVIQEMRRDGIMDYNPIRGMDFKLKRKAKSIAPSKKGGVALSRDDYGKTLEYLLALEPASLVPERTKNNLEHLKETDLRQAESLIDLTLLQMTTGLRVTEANGLTWAGHVDVGEQGSVHVTVDPEMSKTKKGRRIAILDERVAQRIIDRKSKYPKSIYVIGSPADGNKEWSRSATAKATRMLYLELAKTLKINELLTERTHVWRATLNTLLREHVSDVERSAWFGHTVEVNRASYTDLSDTSAMLHASQNLRNNVG
ncbi:hypothetical protein [Glutamicibacter ardleyensis]|uniref:hypothetical protein n=1 Tax=Glutamicibacter ardleyensis TaxID=225894 RepID=UPI003FD5F02D